MKYMEVGADYHDLAEFYWETGEKGKSIQIARKGLKKATGRMDELRAFVAERAQESGDRTTWIGLQFDQTTDCLTLDKYKKFEKACKTEDWKEYEPRLLKKMKDTGKTEQMKIHMDRKEYYCSGMEGDIIMNKRICLETDIKTGEELNEKG